MENLLVRYRPRCLKEVLGQPDVVRALQLYVKDPYSTPMLFHGESGIGKTVCAVALAHDLGVAVEEEDLGGLHMIASGEQTGDTVRETMNRIRLSTLFGSGHRVLIVNEADRCSTTAENVWLDALENLSPRCTVIFTTNFPEKLSRRFRERCESYAFESEPDKLKPAIKNLAGRIWKEEGCKGKCPGLETLGMPTLGDLENMHASFRLALQQLSRYLRSAKAGDSLKDVKKQLAKDNLVTAVVSACCDHCGHDNNVHRGYDSHKCEKCGKRFHIEWE